MSPGLRVDRKDMGIEGSAEVTMTQEEIEDDGRVKDRRRKQKLFGHRDRKWGEGEKRRRVSKWKVAEEEKEVTICIIQTHWNIN